ncbi:hypothetical protein [Kineococcus sp. SYSU DK003]|uniref:hypothetical protein n=1 Tax=Kineococcus sp. SYSU DK003 TaxID=3383124 RepID=UPI003D7E0A9B
MTDERVPTLSAVERRLLELVEAGRSLTTAGAEVALDTDAVTRVVRSLRERFEVRSTAAVVVAAREAGLLTPRAAHDQRVR